MTVRWIPVFALVLSLAAQSARADAPAAGAEESVEVPNLCLDAGPQAPRDIADPAGENPVTFPLAPPASELTLCNIHTHTHAEHKGPGFSVFVGEGKHGGYACNGADELTEAELAPAPGAYGNVEPGDTLEVHWVHTSCDATPGPGLGSCVPEGCSDPLLRVEAQVFLVANDEEALDFTDMVYGGHTADGRPQARRLPSGTGTPVVYRGSTTGPSYTRSKCSPVEVTWSVRPQCARLDIHSLHEWAAGGNAFDETESHGVRSLVTAPELLAPIAASEQPGSRPGAGRQGRGGAGARIFAVFRSAR